MVSTNTSKSSLTFDPKSTLLDLEQLGMIASKSNRGVATALLLTIPDAKTEKDESTHFNLNKHTFDYLVSAVIGTDPVVLEMLTEYAGERDAASLKVLYEIDDHDASTTTSSTKLLCLLKSSLKEDTISDISTALVLNHNLQFNLQNPSENSSHESIICTKRRKHDIHSKNSLKDTNHYKTWLKDTYHSKNSLPDSIHCKDKLSKN
jgi:hypothetical protein